MDAAQPFLDFVQGRRTRRRFKGPPSVLNPLGGGTSTDTDKGKDKGKGTGKATPLAAHVLQQQLNDEIGKMIDKLHQGEMTLSDFNSQKDLMGKLIAANIPLTDDLTKEQQKKKPILSRFIRRLTIIINCSKNLGSHILTLRTNSAKAL